MVEVIVDFIELLRLHGIRISTAEAMDATKTLGLVGYEDKEKLRLALMACLVKTKTDQEIYQRCFTAYYSFQAFTGQTMQADESFVREASSAELSPLSQMLLDQDRAALQQALAAAGEAVNLKGVSWQTQKNVFSREILQSMGLGALEADIANPLRGGSGSLAKALAEMKEQLIEQVDQFVDARYRLYGEARREIILARQLMHKDLAAVSEHELDRMNDIVRKIVKCMQDVHSRRKKRWKHGILDVKKTIRLNLKYGEIPFHLQWKRKKIDRPNIVVLCDISRSMRSVVRFFLMLLYSLNREVVNIRSFAFCSNLAEVSHLFEIYGIEEGIVRLETGHDCNILMARSDYGQAFRDFADRYGTCLSDRTTVIVLGDARNNFGDPATGLLKMIGERSKQVVWLNPEPPTFWGTGDSAMKKYLPFCHVARECKTLFQLERALDSLLA